MVRAVHAAGIVDGVGVEPPALGRIFDAPQLGEAEIAAFADDPAPEVGAIDAHAVIGPVADIAVGFAPRLDIGADAAVPEQIDRRLEDQRDQFGRGRGLGVGAERLPRLRAQRDRLGGPRVDAAPGGQQRAVEIVPGRARQLEEPPALREGCCGVRVRVDEDMHVVEGGHEPDMRGEQHRIAEHIAAHVADADRAEAGRLAVHAELAEMALDRLPAAARGNAHALVVVALRAAGGEGVAEPEAVFRRHPVRNVGEGRGALVGRHHQIGVVAVMAHDMGRRGHPAAGQVVGNVQHAPDEGPVAGGALFLDGLAARRQRRPLREEAALGADRHDHRVLHRLGLGEPQHLGAEVLAPVRPAYAAARHRPAAQMHGLDARRIDEDLILRPRLRQFRNPLRVELEGEVGLRRAAGAGLEIVGAQRGADRAQIAAQDPVLVEIRHLFQRRLDPGRDLERGVEARRPGPPVRPGGVEADREQFDQHPRDRGVGGERILDIGLAEGGPGLAQIFAIGAQHDDLAPADPGPQHQPVEAVILDLAGPDAGERLAEDPLDAVRLEIRAFPVQHPEIVQPHPGRAGALDLAGMFVLDLEAHILQHRQRVGERDRPAPELEQLEAQPPFPGFERPVKAHLDAVLPDALHLLDIEHRDAGGIDLAIVRAEGLPVAPEQAGAGLLAEAVEQGVAQIVRPCAADGPEPPFEVRQVVLRPVPGLDAHDEKQPRQHRFRQAHGELGIGRAERLFEDSLDDPPAARGVAVPRHEHDAGIEAPEPVRVDEQADALPFLQVQDSGRRLEQLPGRHLEQQFARKGIDDVLQRLGGVAVRRIAGAALQFGRLAPQQRDVARRAVEGFGGVEAEKAVFPDDRAAGVEPPEGDTVQMARPVDARAPVGAGDRQQFGRLRAARPRRRRVGHRRRPVLAAQQAQPGAGLGREPGLAAGPADAAGAVSEEGEMVVLEPFEERLHLLPLAACDRCRQRVQLLDGEAHPPAHGAPVLDRDLHIAQRGQHLGRKRIEHAAFRLPVGLDMDRRLDAGLPAAAGVLDRQHRLQAPRAAAAHAQHRVDDEVAGIAARIEHHAHGIDQERQVVGDDLDDGVRRLPAMLLDFGVVNADLCLAGGALAGEVEMRHRRPVKVVRPAFGQVFLRDAGIVEGDERKRRLELAAAQPPARECGDVLEQFGLLRIGPHRHGRPPCRAVRAGRPQTASRRSGRGPEQGRPRSMAAPHINTFPPACGSLPHPIPGAARVRRQAPPRIRSRPKPAPLRAGRARRRCSRAAIPVV